VKKIKVSWQSDKHKNYFTCRTIYDTALIFFTMGNVLDKSCSENQNTNFMFNNFLFRKSCCSWKKIVEKYGTTRQVTDGNI